MIKSSQDKSMIVYELLTSIRHEQVAIFYNCLSVAHELKCCTWGTHEKLLVKFDKAVIHIS